MAEVKEKQSLSDKIIQIYTGGRGGGVSSWLFAIAVLGIVGVGGYFLYKKFFSQSGGYWIEMEVLGEVPATSPSTAAAYWIEMHVLSNLPVIKPSEAAAFWLVTHILSNLPATKETEAAAAWLPMHILTSLPAITIASTAWILKQTILSLPATGTQSTQFTLSVDVDPSDEAGFVEVRVNGEVRLSAPYLVNSGAQVVLTAYPQGNYTFDHWYDSEYQFTTQNPITFSMSQDRAFVANFSPESPPPGGPVFPAPGVVGDGQYWYWIVFTDNSAGWFDLETFLFLTEIEPDMIKTHYGPYASGATS